MWQTSLLFSRVKLELVQRIARDMLVNRQRFSKLAPCCGGTTLLVTACPPSRTTQGDDQIDRSYLVCRSRHLSLPA